MTEISLDKEDFILLGTRKCGSLSILTFYHRQIQPDFDPDWIPSITTVLEKTGIVKPLEYCCIVLTRHFGESQVTLITPEFFEKHHIRAFLYDACHSFLEEEQICLVSFLTDGVFKIDTVQKCILPHPTRKRIQKMINMKESDLHIVVYALKGSNLYYRINQARG